MKTKFCSTCKKTLPVDQFIPRLDPDRRGQFFSRCKPCRAVWQKNKYHTDESYRRCSIENAMISTRKRRERPEVREQERIAYREAKRIQLSDPIEYEKHLQRGRDWCAANPDRVAA